MTPQATRPAAAARRTNTAAATRQRRAHFTSTVRSVAMSAARSAGVPDDRPVSIIESGHTPQQRTTRTTLAHAVDDAAAAGVRNPAVIVVGDVARAGLLLPDRRLTGDAIR